MKTDKTTKEKKQDGREDENKIDPVEIKRAIFETTKDLKHVDKDIEKIEHDREELLADLAELRSYKKGQEEGVVSAANGKLIERSIRAIQKRIQKMSGAITNLSLSETQKKLHTIITEWKEGKKELRGARAAHVRAEQHLAKEPTSRKALGDANRAEATIYDTNLKLDKIAQEAILAESSMAPNPVSDESVDIHTGEEKVESEKLKVGSEEKSEKIEETPVRGIAQEEGIHYTHEQMLADEKERAQILAERDPVQNEWIHYTHEQALADEKVLETTHTIPAESIITDTLSELAQRETPALEIPEEPVARESVSEAREEARKPEETVAHPTELPAPEPHILLEDSETLAEEHKKIAEKKVAPSYADTVLGDHLNKLFGRKGFLGFGAQEGIASPHWMDPNVGFASRTVDEILGSPAQPSTDEEISEGVGIENKQETTKMKDYLSQAIEQTSVAPLANEKAAEYVKRAIATAAGKK